MVKVFVRCLPLALASLLWVANAQATDDFRVVVSIKPIHSIVASLMQGTAGPDLLIGEGQSPYDSDLSERQRNLIKQADLLIWVGPELEAALQMQIDELPGEAEVVELLSNPSLKILPSRLDDNRRDPYFWLDNRNVILLLNDLTQLLQQANPVRSHVYIRNRREMMRRLSRIDREFEYGYRGLKVGLAVAYYDTLQYFEQAYALKILDRVMESPREQLNTASLLQVRQRIQDDEAKCLLTDKSLPMEHLSLLTEGKAVKQGELDFLGSQFQPGPDLYFQLMRHNTEVIKRCLNADLVVTKQAALPTHRDESSLVEEIGGGRFMLTDQYGHLVTAESMLGRYQLLYFGYTHCPDICPNTLQIVSLALDRLGPKAEQIQPYFITVDPERDTVKVLREYIDYFDPRLIGVTGSTAMIERMAAQYKAKYEKVEAASSDPALYLMDHSASLYLMGPNGRFISKFVYGISAEQLAQRLEEHLP